MRVLLDTCVWGGVRKALSDAGYDVIWAGDWPVDPGDEEILERARLETRVLVTLDKDFGELAIVRLVAMSTSRQVEMCLAVLSRYASQLEAGGIVTVDTHRIRIRPAEDRRE